MYDVIIIGGGVIGATLARALSRTQNKVCVLEKESDVAMGASKANSGIVHGGYDPEPGTLKAELNAKGVEMLFQMARELNVPHRRNGSFVCAFGTEEEEAHLRELLSRGEKNGIAGLSLITGDEARALEPMLCAEVSMVLNVPNAGIISPYELALAAMGNAMDNGAALRVNFAVSEITKTEEGFAVKSEAGECVTGRYLVNCAGGAADRVAALVGDSFFTVIPRVGEYMLLDQSEGTRVSRTIFQVPTKAGKGILVTPTADGNLLTGPTAKQVECHTDTRTSPEGLGQVRALAAKSVPSVDFSRVITSFSGVRSSVSGGDFIIRPAQNVQNMLHVAGIDSPGLTCCAAIAAYAVEQLEQMGLSCEENEQFDGHREDPHAFRRMSDEEKDAFIKQNPAYGKIVCRCEQVSEGEIRAAIRQNPPASDIDGVKRRTRSGMGRCQGGFCMPHVMRLIAEERGVPMESVTKKGGDSRQLFGKL